MSRPKRLVRIAALLTTLALAALVVAQAAPDSNGSVVRIGMVDVESAMQQSEVGKKAIADFGAAHEEFKAEQTKRQDAIKEARIDLGKRQPSLSREELDEEFRRIEIQTTEFRRWNDDASRALAAKRDEAFRSLEQKLVAAINQIGKQKGYTLILRKQEGSVLYASDTTDITAQVAAAMNQN